MNNSRWIFVILAAQIVRQIASIPKHSLGSKIVGGHEVKIRSVPFILSLHVRREGFICGAFIISSWWGMTAKHCLKPGTPLAKNYYVRAGSSLNLAGGSTHKLRKFYSSDSKYFDGKTIPSHDVLLFKVETRFRFSNNVMPAKLPLEGKTPPASLRVSGWGRADMSPEGLPSSLFLQTVKVNRIAWTDCIVAKSWYESVANERTHLCYGEESADACYGDSGGPLADNNTVYGIVSFGDGCGESPGVYAKVSYYRRWIKKIARV